jgi:hypothetical protein
MRIKLIICIVALCSLLSSPVLATGYESGNNLLKQCKVDVGLEKVTCLGYVTGVVDVLLARRPLTTFEVCIPDGVSKGQIVAIVVKWLEDHPERRHFLAAGEIFYSLGAVFPC